LADGSTVAGTLSFHLSAFSHRKIVIINWQNSSRSLTFNLADVGFSSVTATDLITGHSVGTLTTSYASPSNFEMLFYQRISCISYTSTVAAHGCLVLKLTAGVPVAPPSFTFYNVAVSSYTIAGAAATRAVNSSVTVVGSLGNGSTLTIHAVDGGTTGGTKTVSLDYINADVAYTNTACSNCRNAFISVNGGEAVQAQMPISGQVSFSLVNRF
jgi:alpha-galactosidase